MPNFRKTLLQLRDAEPYEISFADALRAHVSRVTTEVPGGPPQKIKLTAYEQEILWFVSKGYSVRSIKNHLRLEAKQFRTIIDCLEDKLGGYRLEDAAVVLEILDYAVEDHYPSKLAESFSILQGARIIMPIRSEGFTGLRLALIDGRRVTLWLTSTPDNEIPGWGYLEDPDDPSVLANDDFEFMRSQLVQGVDPAEAVALHKMLEGIIEDAITWLDKLEGDADEEEEPAEDQGDFELSEQGEGSEHTATAA